MMASLFSGEIPRPFWGLGSGDYELPPRRKVNTFGTIFSFLSRTMLSKGIDTNVGYK